MPAARRGARRARASALVNRRAQAPVAGDAASRATPASRRRRSNRLEREPQTLIRALARRQAGAQRAPQLVRELGRVAAAHAPDGRACPRSRTRSRARAAATRADAARVDIAASTPLAEPIDARDELVLPRDDHLRGRRRRRRAQVGDEVGDRDVGLVADGRDHRHRAAGDRARHDLLVERPEILDRSAAAPDDDDVDARRPCAIAREPAGDVERGAFALHARRANHEVRVRVAAAQHVDDVAHGRAVERGDDADLAGQRGQRPLAAPVEQAFGREPLLQLLEGELQRAEPLGLEVLADDLILALRVVDADRGRARRRAGRPPA